MQIYGEKLKKHAGRLHQKRGKGLKITYFWVINAATLFTREKLISRGGGNDRNEQYIPNIYNIK